MAFDLPRVLNFKKKLFKSGYSQATVSNLHVFIAAKKLNKHECKLFLTLPMYTCHSDIY